MRPLSLLAPAALLAVLALGPTAQAQTAAQVPGNDSSPQTLSTHRPGTGKPGDTVQEVTSTTSGSGTSAYRAPAYDADYSDGVLRKLTPDNVIPTRAEVAGEAAAMNRSDTLPRGELSLPAHAGAAEGGFLRKF